MLPKCPARVGGTTFSEARDGRVMPFLALRWSGEKFTRREFREGTVADVDSERPRCQLLNSCV